MLIRNGSRILALALVALTVPLLVAPDARGANVSCQIRSGGTAGVEGNVLQVVDSSQSVTHIYRRGEEIVVSNNADREPALCGRGQPTVTNIDRIEYVTDSGAPFINYGGDGPLAPGATDEPGGDEIEIVIKESYSPKVLNVAASPEADRVEIGQRKQRRVGVNLNAQDDEGSEDVDIEVPFAKGERVYLRIIAKAGDDELSALGAPGFAEPVLAAERLVLIGGPGDDVLRGGPSRDALNGSDGDDQLLGGRGNDRLIAGPGRDRVDCGAGRDDVFKDAGDISLNCEMTDFR